MIDKDNFLQWLVSEPGRAAIAGALGGIVRWITLRESIAEAFGSLIVGAICAMYLSPLVEPILQPIIGPIAPNGDPAGFAAFVVGLGGISLASFVIGTFTARTKRDDDEQA